jgi:hypothetical protein
MGKRLFFLSFFLGALTCNAQCSFKDLSRPEKIWALCHPIKAIQTASVTRDVLLMVDSIKQTRTIGDDISGGNLDAFKHSYWMASLASKIGRKQALKLGRAHEKGNFLQFKKHMLEERILPDSVSSEMDLQNNIVGVSLIDRNKKMNKFAVCQKVLTALKNGKLSIIKKDRDGNYLTCNGEIISLNEWKGKWNIPKCLSASFSK